jgi:glycosyltransferase involved in cell wall biosynthesis
VRTADVPRKQKELCQVSEGKDYSKFKGNETGRFRDEKDLILSLVVPVYNEAETVSLFLDRVDGVLSGISNIKFEIVFVNDGSTDETLERLLTLQKADSRIRIVDLSRNFGKEAALTAGIQAVTGRIVVPIDVDLQDPPELIVEMIEKWYEGYDVVLGRRLNRDSDSFCKRLSASWYYRIHNKIADPHIHENVGDFRLMDHAVIDALRSLPESRRFMKGLFAWVGFKTTFVDYTRPKRSAGSSKFNGWRLWNFALEGITSFSIAPLRLWGYLGCIVALISMLYGVFIILCVMFLGRSVPGYASILVAVVFLGGVQLIGIGVIGEYLGRTYLESKRRPVYVVRSVYEPEGHPNES